MEDDTKPKSDPVDGVVPGIAGADTVDGSPALAETLRAEIARVEQAMGAKQSSLSAAESVFKR